MILPIILIVFLIALGVMTAHLDPGLNPSAAFFGRIVAIICALLAVMFTLALLTKALVEMPKISDLNLSSKRLK